MNLEVKDELIKFADERIKKYLKVLNIPYHLEGKITKINADGTYSVRIQGEEETISAREGLNLKVDDMVLCLALNGDRSRVFIDLKKPKNL